MNIKVIIGVVVLVILCGISFIFGLLYFNKKFSKELEITYKISAGIPFRWEFEIEDESVVEFVKSYVLKDENTGGKVGAPVYTNYVFKGLKKGKTTIVFKCVNFTEDRVTSERRHTVIVDENLNISSVNEE